MTYLSKRIIVDPSGPASRMVRLVAEFLRYSGLLALALLASDVFSWDVLNGHPKQRMTFVVLWGILMAVWHVLGQPRVWRSPHPPVEYRIPIGTQRADSSPRVHFARAYDNRQIDLGAARRSERDGHR